MPAVINNYDFEQIVLTLSDINNPKNKIEVAVSQFDDGRQNQETFRYGLWTCYAMGSVNDSIWVGQESSSGNIHKGNKDNTYAYGTPITFSFCAYDGNGLGIRDYSMKIAFDYSEKVFYVNSTAVCDFDNPAHFDNVWEGFSEGKCYMTVRGGKYKSAQGRFVITNLNGEDIKSNVLIDAEAPVIDIDYGAYSKNEIPNGVVGGAYEIFDAVSVDFVDGECDVEKSVYYRYGNVSNMINVPIVNGTFSPSRDGIYTIEYKATDKSGNVAIETIEVDVLKETDCDILEMQLGQFDSFKIGETVSLLVPTITTDSRLGNVSYGIRIKKGDTEYKSNAYSFLPLEVGSYQVVYTAKDGAGREVQQVRELVVEESAVPVFFDDIEVLIPSHFISGREYILPEINAYLFTNGQKIEQQAKISVTNDSETVEVEDGKYTANATSNNEKVTIMYYVGESSVSCERYVYLLNNQSGLIMQNLFAYDSNVVTSFADNKSISYIASEDTTIKFVNELLANSFEFKFSVDSQNANLTAVSLYLKDALNPNICIKITVHKSGEGAYVTINDGVTAYGLNGLFASESTQFVFRYAQATHSISFESFFLEINRTLDGKSFVGFPSNFINFEICYENTTGQAGLIIYALAGHTFFNSQYDYIKPALYCTGNISGEAVQNSIFTLPIGYAGDVVDGKVISDVSVQAPDGSFATTVDGEIIKNVKSNKEYFIKFDKVGKYTIRYRAEDSSGNVASKFGVITILDEDAPIITVNEVPKTVKVNTIVTLPKATATDNISKDITVYVMIKKPNGEIQYIKGDYKFEEVGTYNVIYFAKDEAGNIATAEYELNVKE